MTADLDRVLARERIRRGKARAESRIDTTSVNGINDLAEARHSRRAFRHGLAVYSLKYSVADGICLGTRYANERNTALALGGGDCGDRAKFGGEHFVITS